MFLEINEKAHLNLRKFINHGLKFQKNKETHKN